MGRLPVTSSADSSQSEAADGGTGSLERPQLSALDYQLGADDKRRVPHSEITNCIQSRSGTEARSAVCAVLVRYQGAVASARDCIRILVAILNKQNALD